MNFQNKIASCLNMFLATEGETPAKAKEDAVTGKVTFPSEILIRYL